MPNHRRALYSQAVNILHYLPKDAGRPVSFSINGSTVVVITDANKCFFYDGKRIHERILWPIEHAAPFDIVC